MLKELEEKAILNPITENKKEPQVIKIDLEGYDNDIFVQDIIPDEDYDELYAECTQRIINPLEDCNIIVKRVLLERYTNIFVESLNDRELYSVFNDIEFQTWCEGDMIYHLFDDVERYYKLFMFEDMMRRVLKDYFSDEVTRNAFEQIQKELNDIDMDKVSSLLEVFGAGNKLNLGG